MAHNEDAYTSAQPGLTVMEVVVSVNPAKDGHSKAVINI